MTEQGEPAALGNQFQDKLRMANWDSALADNELYDARARVRQTEAARDAADQTAGEWGADRDAVIKDVIDDLFEVTHSGEIDSNQAFEVARQIAEEIGDQEFGARIPKLMAFSETLTPDNYVVIHGRVRSIAGPTDRNPGGVHPVFELEQNNDGARLKTSFALPYEGSDGKIHGYLAPTGESAPVIGDREAVIDYLGAVLVQDEMGQDRDDFNKKRNVGDDFAFIGSEELAQHCYDAANDMAVKIVETSIERYDSKSRDLALEAILFLVEHAPDTVAEQFDKHALVFAKANGFPEVAFGARSDLRFAQLYADATATDVKDNKQFADHKMDVLNRLHTRGQELLSQ